MTVKDIKIQAIFMNASGKFLFDKAVFSYHLTDLSIPPNEIYYLEPWQLDERHQTARSALIKISQISFEDGSREYWTEKGSITYTLPIIPLDRIEKLQSFFGYDLLSYGSKEKNSWRCICGVINPSRYKKCRNCQRSKSFVLNTLTEKRIEEKLQSSVFQNYIDLDNTLQEEKYLLQKVEDIEDTRRGAKAINPPKKKKSLRKKIFLAFSSFFLLLFFIYFVQFLCQNLNQRTSLKQAEDYIQTNQYEKALEIYKDFPPTTRNIDITLKIEDTKNLIKSDKMYSSGIENTIKGKPYDALYDFSQVIPEDKENYVRAKAMIVSIKQDEIIKIKKHFSEGDLSQAFMEVENLIEILPNDEEIKTLESDIVNEMQE